MSTAPLFELDDVTFRYHDIAALQGLSLTVTEGQRIALLGANGSGKSTLLRVLDGLYFPESGTVSFRGESLDEARLQDERFAFAFRREVALLFQNPDVQLFNPAVFDEVAFGPLQMGWANAEVTAKVDQALDLLGIAHLRDRAPHQLSGGEKKKVALASVLVLDPEVILLDEPTASLDPRSQTQLIDFLTAWGDGRKTIITATHDLHMLEDIAEICHIFEHGRIVATGSPEEILHDRRLLERANLIHAHRHGHTHLHRES